MPAWVSFSLVVLVLSQAPGGSHFKELADFSERAFDPRN